MKARSSKSTAKSEQKVKRFERVNQAAIREGAKEKRRRCEHVAFKASTPRAWERKPKGGWRKPFMSAHQDIKKKKKNAIVLSETRV